MVYIYICVCIDIERYMVDRYRYRYMLIYALSELGGADIKERALEVLKTQVSIWYICVCVCVDGYS